jgi:hypothetical protein
MPFARFTKFNFASARDFEAFGDTFVRFIHFNLKKG